MIHKATQLVKFKKLQRRLGLALTRDVIGLLEAMWHLTIRNAPSGDIGKLDNETIAIELEWGGDPDLLVEALVECGWLDRSESHRLVVHNWHKHAPDFLKGNLAKWGRGFASCTGPPAIADCSEQVPQQNAQSNLQPNLTKPNKKPVTGVSTKHSGFKKPLADITVEDLKDDKSLAKWFQWQATQPNAVLSATEHNRFRVFCAAERALEVGDNPVALFVKILTSKLWKHITTAQEDRARKRIG